MGSRLGFSLGELLGVLVVGSFLMLAIYQVLVTHSRFYAVGGAQIRGKEMLRSSMELFLGELREISPKGGDLIEMTVNSVTFRSQREFGLVCGTDYRASPPEITVLRVGSWFEAGDSMFVLAGTETDARNAVWLDVNVQSVDTTAVCSAGPAQVLGIPGLGSDGDTVRVGAPVRAFESFTYGLYETDSGWHLGRKAQGASDPVLLLGPPLGPDGATFRYLDRWGRETAADTLVSQIEVTLRYDPSLGVGPGGPVSDSVVARVFPRN